MNKRERVEINLSDSALGWKGRWLKIMGERASWMSIRAKRYMAIAKIQFCGAKIG